MSNQEQASLIRSQAQHTFTTHLSLLEQGRIAEWGALFTEDCILEHPFAPEGFRSLLTGRAEILDYMANFPSQLEVRFTAPQFHETLDPTLIIAEFHCTGKAIATGNPYNQRYISVVRTRHGKIERYTDFWSPLVAMKAMGQGMNAAFQRCAHDGQEQCVREI